MMTVLVDSNVLLDITEPGPWSDWSSRQLENFGESGDLVINQIILAEIACRFEFAAALDGILAAIPISREGLPWEAAHAAGRAHASYRKRGGTRQATLPDFFIGAHAADKGYLLLTRDAGRYRTYFPSVEIVAPDTHP